MTDLEAIRHQAARAAEILLEEAKPEPGALCVIGCSTSEVGGHQIGSASSEEIAAALWAGLMPPLEAAGVFPAVQGCEHINRALCVSRPCARRYGLSEVMVVPWLRAGGAFAACAYERMDQAVMVEDLRAQAVLGMDIGGTLIGMHLRPVAVPIHTPLREIGQARVVMARVRGKYVGGPRARYE